MIRGEVNTLNIGTGGGVETIELLQRGNNVTVVEINEDTAERTRNRVKRNGFSNECEIINDHIFNADLDEEFDQVIMTEVLEHIENDEKVLHKLSDLIQPGGRLILSTPTASYGQLARGGEVSGREDGGHVRVGYDGPELDSILEESGFLTLRRLYTGGRITRILHLFERQVRSSTLGIIRYPLSFLFRPIYVISELYKDKPYTQITIAVKDRTD